MFRSKNSKEEREYFVSRYTSSSLMWYTLLHFWVPMLLNRVQCLVFFLICALVMYLLVFPRLLKSNLKSDVIGLRLVLLLLGFFTGHGQSQLELEFLFTCCLRPSSLDFRIGRLIFTSITLMPSMGLQSLLVMSILQWEMEIQFGIKISEKVKIWFYLLPIYNKQFLNYRHSDTRSL